jgi:hypothetical protein
MADSYEKVITASDEMEAKIIESKLRFYDIKCVLKHRDQGALYSIIAGFSKMPVDIFVDKKVAEDAKKILKAEKGENLED